MHDPEYAQRLVARILLTSLAACLCGSASAVCEAHVVLVPEAPVTLIRDVSIFEVNGPIDVRPGDLISTNAQKGSAQLRDDGGELAALGAGTRVAIGNGSALGAAAETLGAISLLSGWLKVANVGAAPAHDPLRIDTPALHLSLRQGSAVIRAASDTTSLYVETGVVEASIPDTHTTPHALMSDQFAQRALGRPLVQAERPLPAFVDQMPVAFRDPLRPLPNIATNDLPPAQRRAAGYEDLRDWLTCSLPVRATFVPRFQGLLHSKPFRQVVQQHVSELPDWRRALYPKKPSAARPASYARIVKEVS